MRTGVVYRRALHAAAHGERLAASVPPTAAQLDDWRALMVLYVEAAPRPRDETVRDPDSGRFAASGSRRHLARLTPKPTPPTAGPGPVTPCGRAPWRPSPPTVRARAGPYGSVPPRSETRMGRICALWRYLGRAHYGNAPCGLGYSNCPGVGRSDGAFRRGEQNRVPRNGAVRSRPGGHGPNSRQRRRPPRAPARGAIRAGAPRRRSGARRTPPNARGAARRVYRAGWNCSLSSCSGSSSSPWCCSVPWSTTASRSTRDFATYAQAWSAIGHGALDPRSSIVGVPFWQNNAEFAMWPLALLYHLYPHPVTLLWVQDLAVVATELVTFRWISQVVARHDSEFSSRARATIGVVAVLALVANPWVYETIAFDFHFEALAALFAVLVARDVWTGRSGRLRWWVPLALACDAFGGVYLVGVGISAMLAGRRTRRTGALLAAGGGAWLVLLSTVGGLGVGGSGLKAAYGYLVGPHQGRIGPLDIVTGVLTHPGSVAHAVASHVPVVLGLLVAVGLIGLFSSWGIGMATVVLLPNVLDGSGLFLRYAASFQSWPALPFVLVGSVMVVLRLRQRGQWGRKAAAALATTWVAIAGVLAAVVIPTVLPNWVAVDPAAAAVLARAQLAIAPGAEVIASQGIVGRFAQRAPRSTTSGPVGRPFPSRRAPWCSSSASTRGWRTRSGARGRRSGSCGRSCTPPSCAPARASTSSTGRRPRAPPPSRFRSGPRRSSDLLHQPAVSVRVAERQERSVVLALGVGARHLRPRLEVKEVARRHAAPHQLSPGRFDVGHDQVQPLHGAGCRRVGHQGDGAGRAVRGHLDDAEVVPGAVVDEQVESGLLGVEGLGAVQVGYRQHHELELPVHAHPFSVGASIRRL